MHEMSRVFVAFKYHIHTCTTWHVYLLAWRTIIVRLRCQPFQLLNFFNEWHVFLQNFLRQNKWVKVYTHTIHTAWFAQYSFSNTQKKHISYFKLQISLFFFAKTTCRRLILLIGALSCILYVLLFSLDRIHTVQLMMNYLPEHKRCRCLLMPW